MFQPITSSNVHNAHHQIARVISEHAEWFCTFATDDVQSLRRHEINVAVSQNRLVLSCWTDKGSRSWRILGWLLNGQILYLQASTRMGAQRPVIELIPRASGGAVGATIRVARQLRCDRLARLACAQLVDAKIERSSLSPGIRRGEPGRYARIVLRLKRQRIAVTGSVTSTIGAEVDALLSSSLLWFLRTGERARPPYIEQLWLIVSEDLLKPVSCRLVLLRESLRQSIRVFTVDDEITQIQCTEHPERRDLWRRKLARFPPVPSAALTRRAEEIVAIAPNAIDVVGARHGETLRYLGLPFARVRSLMGTQAVWFGVEGTHRRLLEPSSIGDFQRLLSDLREYRSADAVDHHHALYRNAAEAWLESLLRRDITKLDPGLIIAPLHAQFRTARGGKLGIRPIDMLALRQDGRLVVIELKVSEDREHVLQGADYWRRVEAHRRRGHIEKARLFGNRNISDETPLVYLVAPTLRVHPSFRTLARCIATDIEIYRFDINENWRSGVRVMRRMKVN